MFDSCLKCSQILTGKGIKRDDLIVVVVKEDVCVIERVDLPDAAPVAVVVEIFTDEDTAVLIDHTTLHVHAEVVGDAWAGHPWGEKE